MDRIKQLRWNQVSLKCNKEREDWIYGSWRFFCVDECTSQYDPHVNIIDCFIVVAVVVVVVV